MGVSDTSDRGLALQWVDRPVVAEAVFFVIGATVLCALAVFQKSAMNEDITAVLGYVLPFFFGGFSAALLGYFNSRSRRHLMNHLLARAASDAL